MDIASIVAYPWVVPVVCGSIIAIVSILGGVISDCLKNIAQTNLKRSMIENGYSVADIDHVLEMGKGARHSVGKEKLVPAKF